MAIQTTGLSHRRAIIVGAGQSGLAVAAALTAQGLTPQQDFVVIDKGTGERSWASRWHSLALLSNARDSSLSHLSFPGDQRRHPMAHEVSDYLTAFETSIGVAPVWGVQATDVARHGTGSTITLATTIGDVQTRNVVCATGAAARPKYPGWIGEIALPGVVLHSSQYQFPRQIPAGDVLIVGGGNAGVQLARELNASHDVTLAVRTPRPRRRLSSFPAASHQRTGPFRRKPRREPLFTETYAHLQRDGVSVVPGVSGAHGEAVTLTDGTLLTPTSMILATGWFPGDDWLPPDARHITAPRTQTAVPGLFVAGMSRYSGPGADTLHGVWADAATIARHIINRP